MKTKLIIPATISTIAAIGALTSIAYAANSIPEDSHIYEGFGDYHRTMTTESPEAQKWFDQGMQLLYGFNHDEAIRSFEAAAALDPEAAMPYWGISYAHGININDPEMTEARSEAARKAADEALARIENASPKEKALIQAVSARYEFPHPEDRSHLDQAYADAMEKAHASFPEDVDIAALFADSLMNLQPWNYWDNEGNPVARAEEIVAVLEEALKVNPLHPGANHFYIHTVEASSDPDRAEAAADRLQTLVPGAGHLVHMPSHIYVRIGRYNDAVESNAKAIEVDRTYFETAPQPAMYTIYYAHNQHFLAYAAMMSGRYADALKASRDLEAEMPEEALRELAFLIDGIMPSTFHTMIRFGKWEDILKEPAYPDFRFMSNAVRLYARSIANSALGHTEAARKEMAAFEEAIKVVPEEWYVFNNTVGDILPIARAMIKGELLYREGAYDKAFAILREGIAAEDALVYDEPPGWMLPVRHSLGALLMEQKRYAKAEEVYREDLKRNRDNGWALLGLENALLAQKKNSIESIQLSGKLATAWSEADTLPSSSCFCAPATL